MLNQSDWKWLSVESGVRAWASELLQPRFVDTNDTSRQEIDLFPIACHHEHHHLSRDGNRSVSGHNDAAMSALVLLSLSLFFHFVLMHLLSLHQWHCHSVCIEWDMSFWVKTSRRKRALMLLMSWSLRASLPSRSFDGSPVYFLFIWLFLRAYLMQL